MQHPSNSTLPGPSIDVDSNARDETVNTESLDETALDVVMKDVDGSDTERMKEQSDVVMNDVEPSAQVYEGISGFEFVDPKEMLLQKKNQNGEIRSTLMWEVWEEEHRRWIDQNITEDVDLDQQNTINDELLEAPSELATELLRYQKEWLAWALKQEKSVIRGGILADEMGMGKTVQAIAFVLAKREIRRAINGADGSDLSPRLSTAFPVVNCTLVICPKSALNVWKSEIERFTREGSTKVMCYHGPKRVGGYLQFLEYDFVITTYNVVEADYRNVMSPKQKCQSCGKKYYERSMDNHRKYCIKEKKSHSGKKLKLCGEYHISKDSGSQPEPEEDYNVEANVRNSALHSVKWERIVLDEAHSIKNKSSNTAKAVYALEASYKWALSGTPLQNRVGELYSLVRFLQVAPYSYHFCKDCDCRILDYSSSSYCEGCPHKSKRHFCWWNKNVEEPIKSHGNSGEGQRAMVLLKHKILRSILLRRTKAGRASDVALPSRVVSLRRDFLDDKEEDYYQLLYNESQAQFNTYVDKGTVMNNYAHIFALLTRLRQALDHPYLVQFSRSNSLRNESDNSEQTCGICHDPVEDPTVASCGHLFCKICFTDFSPSLGQSSCPSCSKPVTVDFTSNSSTVVQRSLLAADGFKFKSSSILNRINLDKFQTSTKIEALREEIRYMIQNDRSAKGIVFSQFTSFLDLIMYSLNKSGITCVLLDGSMPITARDNAIKRFREDSDCRVFLISLKAGGVALNLTVASHVFLMDPWWNPAIERQAMDRIHRIGQHKPIRIVRFVIANTIEERILKLQEKKELLFEGTVGGSSDALARLTVADLKDVFFS